MPRVTLQERRQAYRIDAAQEAAIQLGLPIARHALVPLLSKAYILFRVYKRLEPIQQLLRRYLPQILFTSVLPAMVYARLRAWLDVRDNLPAQKKPPPEPSPFVRNAPLTLDFLSGSQFTEALKKLRQRRHAPPDLLGRLGQSMGTNVLTIAQKASADVEAKLQKAFAETFRRGLHVQEGVARLERAFSAAGITPTSSGQIETIFRTQTMLAYAAGEAEQMADPDIQEILWGYKYVTVGDDRVRPTHAALEGVTLPKDDPFWETNTPPNGYNCRCKRIAIFDERKPSPPPDKIIVDGEKVMTPGADPGFQFNPLELFNRVLQPEIKLG